MSVKINTRSPYFLKYENPNLTKVDLNLHIYSGTVEVDKGAVDYQLTNEVIAGNDYVIFEVSELVRDYFEHSFDGTYGSNTLWLTAEATLYNNATELSTINNSYLIVDGYNSYQDGVNSQGSRDLLLSARTVLIPEGETMRIPVFSEDVVSLSTFTLQTQNASATMKWNEADRNWEVEDLYWDNEASESVSTINETVTLSDGKIQYGIISHNNNMFRVSTEDTQINVNITEYCTGRFGYQKVVFVNKHGALQDVFFVGARKDRVEVEGSEYKSSPIDFVTMDYDVYKGQVNKYGVHSKRGFTLNSGWRHESENETFEELLMTENAWIVENNVPYPILVQSRSLDKKKHVTDGLINYAIDFTYAFDNNNTVI